MWSTCCHPPGGVPVSARVLYRLLSLNGVPALVYFTHAIIYLRGVSSVVEGLFPRWWLQPCLLCLTPLLLLDMCEWRHHKLLCLVEFLILSGIFWPVSWPYGTVWDWHRAIHCLLPHSSPCYQKSAIYAQYKTKHNYSDVLHTQPWNGIWYLPRLGELAKEYEWWQNVLNLVSVETSRLWTDRPFME